RRYLHALDRLVSIFTLAQAFDARLVPQGIARQFESVAALGTEVRRLRERCDLVSGSERDAALKQFSDSRFEQARAQREVLLAQLPYLIGRFGYIK
ncbi:MAG: hypothetical protein J0M12_10140, partial [Deltaproteobacteria bacterium]|nr:hypothetical protein [Deltaproteobacteria bacterium]